MDNELVLIDGSASPARREMHNGRPHVVVPVIALKEGVIHAMNSKANEFVPAAELTVNGWQDKPIFIGHPVTKNNVPISAKTPGVMETAIGFVRNASVSDKQLLLEAWVDEAKAEEADILEVLNAGLGMDVSIGAFVRTDEVAGEHGGKSYAGSWHDIVPDHLALLPGQKGACSWDMGCGVRAASQYRTAWPDKDGMDDHGRAASMHDRASKAHTLAAKANRDAAAGDANKEFQAKVVGRANDATEHAAKMSMHADNETTKAIGTKLYPSGSQQEIASNASDNTLEHSAGAKNALARPARADNSGRYRSAANHHDEAAREHQVAAAAHRAMSSGRNAQEGGYMEMADVLKTLRNIPQDVRDKMSKDDFAGPNESFPIEKPVDVGNAARAIGRAKGDPSAIKARIIAIAYRKGGAFVDALPDDWKKGTKNASGFIKMLAEYFGLSEDAPELKAASCSCHAKETDTMNEKEMAEFLKTATPEQLKTLGVVKAPTEAEVKAAADAAAAKVTKDKKDATIKSLKDTGKNDRTDAALEAMSQEQLDGLLKAACAPTAPTFAELLEKADPATREAIKAAQEAATAKKTVSVKALVDTKRCGYTEAELKAMSQDQLDKLIVLAAIKTEGTVDYSGQGLPRTDGDPKDNLAPAAPDLNAALKAAAKK